MNKKVISIESFFVMLLFVSFVIAMVLMIIGGKTSYTNILDQKAEAEERRISASYLRMKLKQNNHLNGLAVVHNLDLGIDLLEIRDKGLDSQYKTVIYYYRGKIYEAYLGLEDRFDTSLGEAVIDLSVEAIKFDRTPQGLEITYIGQANQWQQFVAVQ